MKFERRIVKPLIAFWNEAFGRKITDERGFLARRKVALNGPDYYATLMILDHETILRAKNRKLDLFAKENVSMQNRPFIFLPAWWGTLARPGRGSVPRR